MKNPIVELVEKEMTQFRELRLAHPNLFPENNNLYPIPFFGDIRRAELITLALNPSCREFDLDRHWPANNGPEALTPSDLTNRLLSYFHLRKVKRYGWLDECEKGLLMLGCSYQRNAAHIDLHPLPTRFANRLNAEEAAALREIVLTRSAKHLMSVLEMCERVKLIVVVDYAVPVAEGPSQTTFEFVRDRLSLLGGVADGTGVEPPLVRGGEHKAMANRMFEHRTRLQSYLLNAPSLIFST